MLSTRYYRAMTNIAHTRIRELLERLARINAAEEWEDDLNPTQWAALAYLARANRFSRAPSQVADYLAATRGTVSQTLKALARKQLVKEVRSDTDRRWISYELSDEGQQRLTRSTLLDNALASLPDGQVSALDEGLAALATSMLQSRKLRPFGICNQCRHFRKSEQGAACALLKIDLHTAETNQICHEQEPA